MKSSLEVEDFWASAKFQATTVNMMNSEHFKINRTLPSDINIDFCYEVKVIRRHFLLNFEHNFYSKFDFSLG